MPSGKAVWVRGLQFVGMSGSGHGIVIDVKPEKGGSGAGASNTELVLISLCGCTGMDVASILKKQRIEFDSLEVTAEGEISADLPNRFIGIDLVYKVWGDVPEAALQRAIELSKQKYCTVSNTLSGVAEISYRYEINPEP